MNSFPNLIADLRYFSTGENFWPIFILALAFLGQTVYTFGNIEIQKDSLFILSFETFIKFPCRFFCLFSRCCPIHIWRWTSFPDTLSFVPTPPAPSRVRVCGCVLLSVRPADSEYATFCNTDHMAHSLHMAPHTHTPTHTITRIRTHIHFSHMERQRLCGPKINF